MNSTSWSSGLSLAADGTGVVAHAGGVAVRLLADRVGLTQALSLALARRSFTPVHDRGRVLVDVATMLAGGGEAIADIDTLRHQGQVLGPVASPPTVWRALAELTPARLRRVEQARAKTRAGVWARLPDGRPPAATVAGVSLPADLVVLDVDATIVVAHSEKENARATFKRTFGFHPIGVWCDLFEHHDGWRYQVVATNTAAGQLAFLEARHRAHARVEDRIRHAKDTGLARLPSREYAINEAWIACVTLAADLTAWLRLLALPESLKACEPKALRYRLLHVPARLTRGARRRRLRFPQGWPWAAELQATFSNVMALAPG